MNCVSLFSGAGGLDLGLEAAGFRIVASVEQDRQCCATLSANGRRAVVKDSTRSIDFRSLIAGKQVDLLAGGPPCQPFSKSALWTNVGSRGLSDPRTSTISDYFRAVEEIGPRAFILENVEGFQSLGGLSLIKEHVEQLAAKGLRYNLSTQILDASAYGVPQKRRRFFAVGLQGNDYFSFPGPTHGPGLKPFVTAWDACARSSSCEYEEDLMPKGRWAALLSSIPAGHNYLWHTARGDGQELFGWRTRYWSFLLKLDPSRPSPTIVASPSQNSGPFHWMDRLLSTTEILAIQSFPADYVIKGNRAERQRQLGNAVPPLLAEHIARSLLDALGRPTKRKLTHIIQPVHYDASLIKSPDDVPEKYRDIIGHHAHHPGPGLGPKPRVNVKQPAEA